MMTASRGDRIWVYYWGKARPAVVLRVMFSGRLWILPGSTQPQTDPHLTVDPQDPDDRIRRRVASNWLNGVTHFPIPRDPTLVEISTLQSPAPGIGPNCGKCHPDFFLDVEEFLRAHFRWTPGVAIGATPTALDAGPAPTRHTAPQHAPAAAPDPIGGNDVQ